MRLTKLMILMMMMMILSLTNLVFAGALEDRLFEAAKEGNEEKVQELIDKGANVKAKNKLGRTPLHYAALSDDVDMARFLRKKGASYKVKDKEGKTPYNFALSNKMKRLLKRERTKIVKPLSTSL